MRINGYGITDAGRVKTVNQDSMFYAVTPDGQTGIFVAADGVGGLANGEVASSIAAQTISEWWDGFAKSVQLAADPDYIIENLADTVYAINGKIQEFNSRNQQSSATTLSLLLLHRGMYYIAQVGDSRVYYVTAHNGAFIANQITVDQSKDVIKEQNGKQVVRSMLTEGLGYRRGLKCDFTYGVLDPGTNAFMVCSDGVYKKQSPEQISATVAFNFNDPEAVCVRLIANAIQAGESDNITALFARVEN